MTIDETVDKTKEVVKQISNDFNKSDKLSKAKELIKSSNANRKKPIFKSKDNELNYNNFSFNVKVKRQGPTNIVVIFTTFGVGEYNSDPKIKEMIDEYAKNIVKKVDPSLSYEIETYPEINMVYISLALKDADKIINERRIKQLKMQLNKEQKLLNDPSYKKSFATKKIMENKVKRYQQRLNEFGAQESFIEWCDNIIIDD